MKHLLTLLALSTLCLGGLAGCESDGQDIDDAAEEIEDEMEDAGDDVEDAFDD